MSSSNISRKPVEQSYMASLFLQGVAVLLYAVVVQIVIKDAGMASITTLITGFALLRVAYSPDEIIVFSTVVYGVAFIVGLTFLIFLPPVQSPEMVVPHLNYFHFKILYLLVTGGSLVHSYFVFLAVEDRSSGPF